MSEEKPAVTTPPPLHNSVRSMDYKLLYPQKDIRHTTAALPAAFPAVHRPPEDAQPLTV